ncbi:hypothetical protein BDV95DRAFT_602322 [Massariosphaeria phaeospora]|uniref:RRM domain-containing protein n=1 Tax=Massariosphaeria phaeospora TaxID=100035 RepID=A0A7C8IF90_9PLEO|nr:hypothetical protein BDV95DRAFT_602322 [Massariosphaeria phaeospora]
MASIGAPGVVTRVILPNQTLYCHNLNDKLHKDDLRRNLYMLFTTYGIILDIVALKTRAMRGQAHIVFRDIDSSTQAMRALQGFTFFGKDMKIAYANTKSDTIAKLDGTFKLPETELQPEHSGAETAEQTPGQLVVFGKAPAIKAIPINQQDDTAKGVKRGREQEDSESDNDVEMEVSDDEDDD